MSCFDYCWLLRVPTRVSGLRTGVSFSLMSFDAKTSLSYFFVKKISLSRRVEYVVDGSMDQWVSEWEMYVCHTNQIGSTVNSQSNFLF